MSKKRRKARPWSVDAAIARTSARERLTGETWRTVVEREVQAQGPWRPRFQSYVATHEDALGPRWAALFLSFWRCPLSHEDHVATLHEALQAFPRCGLVESLMGERLLLHYGRILRARKQLTLAATLEPDMASPHYHLAQAHHLLGMPEPARTEFLAATRCAGDSFYEREIAARSLHNVAAIVVNSGGDHDEAAGLLRRALEQMPDYPEACETLRVLEEHARSRGRRVAPAPDKAPTS